MMTDEMGRSIAVEDRHLAVHEDDIRFWVSRAGSFQQIVESFLAIPHRTYGESELFDCLESDLLVHSTVTSPSAICFMDMKELIREQTLTYLSSTINTWTFSRSISCWLDPSFEPSPEDIGSEPVPVRLLR